MNGIREDIVGDAPVALPALFEWQREAFARERYPTLVVRRDRLARLKSLVVDHEARFIEAVAADFGHRSAHETRLAELYIVAVGIAHAQANLGR